MTEVRRSVRRILVLRGGALGDFIVTLPALVALKQTWPDARVEFGGNAAAAQIARARGILDSVHSQHEARWSTLYSDDSLPDDLGAWLRTFDLVLNFWPDPDGTLAAHFPRSAEQQFVTATAVPDGAPAAAHFNAALAPLGITNGSVFFPLHSLAPTRGAPDATPRVAVHPGSGSRTKNWPQDRWIELILNLALPTVVVVGEAEGDAWSDATLRRTILAGRLADGSVRVMSHASLEELINQFSCVDLFIGHDSGVSHLAAACGTPCVLLFGPTDPATWSPPAPHVTVLQNGSDLRAIGVTDVDRAAKQRLVAANHSDSPIRSRGSK